MRVELLYFDGCPSWRVAYERLQLALRESGIQAEVEVVEVRTDEEAARRLFRGSPTVRIDGEDLFSEPGAATGLACRVYSTPAGLAGSPTLEQFVEALRLRGERS